MGLAEPELVDDDVAEAVEVAELVAVLVAVPEPVRLPVAVALTEADGVGDGVEGGASLRSPIHPVLFRGGKWVKLLLLMSVDDDDNPPSAPGSSEPAPRPSQRSVERTPLCRLLE